MNVNFFRCTERKPTRERIRNYSYRGVFGRGKKLLIELEEK
jgi:hypothetical protein